MSNSPKLIIAVETQLKSDLTAPRFLNEQVLEEITTKYDYAGDQLGEFFAECYLTLEDYQADIIFSPLFTPSWEDKLRHANILGFETLTDEEVKSLVNRLYEQNLKVTFQTQTGETWQAALQEANLGRYVTRMMLHQGLSENLIAKIKSYVPENEQFAVALLARDSVWEGTKRENILSDYLHVFHAQNEFSLDKIRYLTDFVRTYRPDSHQDLVRQLESMIKSCESDLNNVADQSFYDQQFKELYSDSERAHFKNVNVQNRYQYLMTMAEAMLEAEKALLRIH